MRKILYTSILFLITNFCFSQNVNFIIQVNDKLLNYGEIANLYLTSGKENDTKKYYLNYFPGELILNEQVLLEINLNTSKKIYLHFDYYTYKKDKQEIANFDIELNSALFKEPYLIANIFDFRDKKYRYWYQPLTKENYLVQLTYPNSGLYIRRK
ncbi:hypothetical protein [Flavobacterium sp. WC2430]|uniref:hypothetical protein n=1 Tax=Flavobacterium sp. WC2430 TaxID=3234137 RepID=UPI00346595DF